MVNLLAKEFSLMSISSLVHVDVPSKSVFKLVPNSDSNNKDNDNIYFNCDKSDILEKWAAALSNLQSSFSNDLITSTISEEEYYDLINYSEDSSGNSNNSFLGTTGAGLKSAFGSASTKSSQTTTGGSPPMAAATTKLPPGVNPKFYESTINSIVLKKKPAKIVILLNQLNSNVASSVAIKNIVKSLLLIRIDIMMLFTSTNDLTGQSEVVLKGDIQKRYNAEEYTHFLGLVDEYASILETSCHGSNSNGYFTHSGVGDDDGVPCATKTANPSSTAKSNVTSSKFDSTNNSNTVEKHLTSYVSQNSHIPLDDLVTIILSATTLEKLQHLPVINTLPIEISTTPLFHRHNANRNSVSSTNGNRVSVATLANWDDAMEVICWHCGLEFDDSDFSSSDESDDSDLDSDSDSDTPEGAVEFRKRLFESKKKMELEKQQKEQEEQLQQQKLQQEQASTSKPGLLTPAHPQQQNQMKRSSPLRHQQKQSFSSALDSDRDADETLEMNNNSILNDTTVILPPPRFHSKSILASSSDEDNDSDTESDSDDLDSDDDVAGIVARLANDNQNKNTDNDAADVGGVGGWDNLINDLDEALKEI
ncbi:unnamed protein product [Ambrosiozyma monospora]|uniref:Unnamed protein product n=1 Tax=Ambrosiozyma monospora TaxID=43982 RepID=A0ACB5T291_AMBMO|nr:unnamed protein product [Ambrosiozyma monospora]